MLGKVLLTFVILLVSVLFMVWFERKLHADMSNRLGPNRAGPFGLFQTLADGIKFFFKEDLLPDRADKWIFIIAPFLSLVPAFLVFSIIPIGGDFSASKQGAITIAHHHTFMQLADPPIGILLFLACSSIAVYGVMLAGWSSGSKYPLLGSVRASAQMVSYEAALGMSVVTVVLLAGLAVDPRHRPQPGRPRLRRDHPALEHHRHRDRAVRDLPHRRHGRDEPAAVRPRRGRAGAGRRLPHRVLLDPLRPLLPRRVHEHGRHVGDHRHAVPRRARPARCSFGPGWMWGSIWFVAKLFIFLFVFVWFRATLPRLRYDQLMDLGWKVLIPLSLGWLLMLATINVSRDQGWNLGLVLAGGFIALVGAYGLLAAAVRTAQLRRDETEGVSS